MFVKLVKIQNSLKFSVVRSYRNGARRPRSKYLAYFGSIKLADLSNPRVIDTFLSSGTRRLIEAGFSDVQNKFLIRQICLKCPSVAAYLSTSSI